MLRHANSFARALRTPRRRERAAQRSHRVGAATGPRRPSSCSLTRRAAAERKRKRRQGERNERGGMTGAGGQARESYVKIGYAWPAREREREGGGKNPRDAPGDLWGKVGYVSGRAPFFFRRGAPSSSLSSNLTLLSTDAWRSEVGLLSFCASRKRGSDLGHTRQALPANSSPEV